MKIEALAYFLDVCETHSLNKSANRLFLTQPGLTKSIQNLENEIGISLFERDRSGIFLNPSGEAFRPYAEKIVELYKSAISHASQQLTFSSVFTLLTQPIYSEIFMPAFLDDLYQRFPNLSIDLVDNSSWTEQKSLFSYMDESPTSSVMLISLLSSDYQRLSDKYHIVLLGEENSVCYISEAHSYAKYRTISYDFLLDNYSTVCFWNRPYFNLELLNKNFSSVSNLTILKKMVLHRKYIVCFPPQIGDRIFLNEPVVRIPLTGFEPVHYLLITNHQFASEFHPVLRLLKNDGLTFFKECHFHKN